MSQKIDKLLREDYFPVTVVVLKGVRLLIKASEGPCDLGVAERPPLLSVALSVGESLEAKRNLVRSKTAPYISPKPLEKEVLELPVSN